MEARGCVSFVTELFLKWLRRDEGGRGVSFVKVRPGG